MGNTVTGFRLAALAAAIMANSCGSAPTAATSTPHVVPQTIMILDAHPVPEELTIAVGERASFMNHDTTSYTIAGGREPSSPDCPEISVVGALEPGHTRDAAIHVGEDLRVPRPARSGCPTQRPNHHPLMSHRGG